ncbi:unnamed protein product [Ranitomeya imitator]|uniref:Uncharacterized protein n=1 Tax=Ranitomeya imitator TaxID=111125 RepID=A0ABN9LT33_9NEOB|nr:unnamed protein product [Ranitomeya imitator]
MDLGSDACSRSSSESSSNKVTPCSDCKSSPSLDLAALEDYEEEEDFMVDKVSDEWEDEDEEEEVGGDDDFPKDNCFSRTVTARSLAEEFEDIKGGHLSATNGNPSHRHKLNGNLVTAKPPSRSKHSPPKPQNNSVRGPPLNSFVGSGGLMREEPQLPTMDWEALEKHLAGLQFQEQESRNQKQARSNYTSADYGQNPPEKDASDHKTHLDFRVGNYGKKKKTEAKNVVNSVLKITYTGKYGPLIPILVCMDLIPILGHAYQDWDGANHTSKGMGPIHHSRMPGRNEYSLLSTPMGVECSAYSSL